MAFEPIDQLSASAHLRAMASLLALVDFISFACYHLVSSILALVPLLPKHPGPTSQHVVSASYHPIVLVTGTSSGIGRAAAVELARLGYTVVCTVRRDTDAELVKNEIHATADSENWIPRVHCIIMDMSDMDLVRRGAQRVLELSRELGDLPIAGLVNNAGVALTRPTELTHPDLVRYQYETNLFGPMELTRLLLPKLRASHGRIINIGSASAIITPPWYGLYAGTKAALRAWTDALRLELAPHGVGVSLVEPGAIRTPGPGKWLEEIRAFYSTPWQDTGLAASSCVDDPRVLYPPSGHIRLFEIGDREAMDCECVTRAIVDALQARYNKERYSVGLDARALGVAQWVLGMRWIDVIQRLLFAPTPEKE